MKQIALLAILLMVGCSSLKVHYGITTDGRAFVLEKRGAKVKAYEIDQKNQPVMYMNIIKSVYLASIPKWIETKHRIDSLWEHKERYERFGK